jgi:ribA/ribD-fused uncharacterized protein
MTDVSRVVEPRAYRRAEAITFQKTNERFGALSNMAPGFPLEVNGIPFGTSEVLYQAFRFPHLPDVQRMIIAEKSPMTAKMKSKPYRVFSRPDFEQMKVSVMRWCLRVKLLQNWNGFAAVLEATLDRPIVEVSTKDSFWGARPESEDQLIGGNVMGRLLMELREQLRGPMRETLKQPIQPPDLPALFILGRPVETARPERRTRPGAMNIVAQDLPTTTPLVRLSLEDSGVRRAVTDELLSIAQLVSCFAFVLHSRPGNAQRLRTSLAHAFRLTNVASTSVDGDDDESEAERLPLFAHTYAHERSD